jgi:trk system potassium uptake protein TrkA
MQLIVVGAGPVGASLVELALEEGHDVTLIEADRDKAERMAERFDARVIHAHIAEGGALEEADVEHAGALVATTDDDADNLMAMVLGRDAEIATLVTIVNDQSHAGLFRRLGVHVLLDPEAIVAQHLYGILCRPEVEDSVALPGGGLAFEIELGAGGSLAGRTLAEIQAEDLLPDDVRIVWVRENGRGVCPATDRKLEAGDRLTVFASEPLSQDALAAFGATSRT